VSLYVEAKSFDEISMSAAARRVVPLTTDNDLTSLNSKSIDQLDNAFGVVMKGSES
jgi:hypothetical protein